MGTHHIRIETRGIRRTRIVLVTVAAFVLSVYPGAARAQTLGCTAEPSWGQPVDVAAAELLALTNAHRTSLNLGALEVSPSLVAAAEWKAAHMAATGYFFHDDPDRSWSRRIGDCGYPDRATENIGWGYATAVDALAGWLRSDGHRAHIEDPDAVVTGMAMVTNDAGVTYWVQVFGVANDTVSPPTEAATEPVADPPDETSPEASAETPAAASGSRIESHSWIRLGPRALRSEPTRIDPR